ncbi:MAG: hypothetical protein HYZ27_10905 [Deltaproteobacteria bacterium]|nr:hypothetical protein [Deltaproteobacteria bacterium]
MLRPETLCTLDQSWSARLGCRLPGLLGTRTVVAAHGKDLAGYFGV